MWLSHFQIGGISEINSGSSLSPAELKASISKRREELHKAGVRPQMRVILYQQNSISFFVDLFACWICEACAIPLDGKAQELVKRQWERWLKPHWIIETDGKLREASSASDLWPNEIALGLLTSGSTGQARLILHTTSSIARKMEALATAIPLDDIDVTLCALPTHFGHGLICNSLFPLVHGAQVFIADSFSPSFVSELDRVVNHHQIRFLSSTPSTWAIAEEFANIERKPSLKRVHCASAVLDGQHLKSLLRWADTATSWNVYGLTEFLGWVSGAPVEADGPHVGSGWSTEIRIDEKGEIHLRAPFKMHAVLESENVNELNPIPANDWFATRDRGELLEGRLRILGRLDFLVNKGGLKIQPEEVESVLSTHPSVRDCMCGAIFDPLWGQKLAALISLKGGSTVEEAELRAWLSERISSYKIPDSIAFTPEIQRNSRGKLNRANFTELWNQANGGTD